MELQWVPASVARRARGPGAEAAGGNVAAAAAVVVPNHPPNCPRLKTVSPVRVPKAFSGGNAQGGAGGMGKRRGGGAAGSL